jgi:hypothetical protein
MFTVDATITYKPNYSVANEDDVISLNFRNVKDYSLVKRKYESRVKKLDNFNDHKMRF